MLKNISTFTEFKNRLQNWIHRRRKPVNWIQSLCDDDNLAGTTFGWSRTLLGGTRIIRLQKLPSTLNSASSKIYKLNTISIYLLWQLFSHKPIWWNPHGSDHKIILKIEFIDHKNLYIEYQIELHSHQPQLTFWNHPVEFTDL